MFVKGGEKECFDMWDVWELGKREICIKQDPLAIREGVLILDCYSQTIICNDDYLSRVTSTGTVNDTYTFSPIFS